MNGNGLNVTSATISAKTRKSAAIALQGRNGLDSRGQTHMNMERLSTCVSAAWIIALCSVVVSSGVLLTLPDNGTTWGVLLWGSIGTAWAALAVGFVLQRKFVAGVRAGSRHAK
jgi:hypothetical protein